MFSILQKSQESINAEDLETLQNEIEKKLVKIVTQKWELEAELHCLNNNTSPDSLPNNPSSNSTSNITSNQTATATSSSSQPTSSNNNSLAAKLRNRNNLVQDISENSVDGLKSSSCPTSNSYTNSFNNLGSASCTNSHEDSLSSEGSIVSSLTGSTIIASTISEATSSIQPPNSTLSSANNHASSTSTNTSGVKRASKSNDRPSKRFRQNSNNSLTSSSGNLNNRPPHSKHRSKIVPTKFRNQIEEFRPDKKQIPRNEAPDKLWPFVEQFCATPTQKEILELEDMIKAMENDKDYFKVPTLGKKELSVKDSPSKNDLKNQKKTKIKVEDEGVGLGTLTQRLVSSLIEEGDSNGSDTTKDSSSQGSKKKNSKQTKSGKGIDMNHARNLERRIRQELEDYHILNQQDDIPYTSEDDEVLRDLVASQHELLTIQNQNKESMQRLLQRAKKHIELEMERAKLHEANEDVIATYYRLIQAKQRKRNPTKKEKDAAWKAVKTQDAIYKKCDELYISNLSRSS